MKRGEAVERLVQTLAGTRPSWPRMVTFGIDDMLRSPRGRVNVKRIWFPEPEQD